MAINAEYVRGLVFEPRETIITDHAAMLYALSIGIGRNPLDEDDLRYVYEEGLKVFPTMSVVIGHPQSWMDDPRTGITPSMVVHGGQKLAMPGALPIGRPIITHNRIADILDKGDKGAILITKRETFDGESGALLAVSESSVFCRADGGFGGTAGPTDHVFSPVPVRTPDQVIAFPTDPRMALLYRLNHDRNPLHASPAFARQAGYPRPILHGLALYGAVANVIAKSVPSGRLEAIECRFSAPSFPGETMMLELWSEGAALAFRVRATERGAIVLDSGHAKIN